MAPERALTIRPPTRSHPRRLLRWAAGLALLTALGACALFEASIDFNEYELRGVDYDEAFELVETVTRRFYSQRFSVLGGFELSAEPRTGRMELSPVVAGSRRMTLYLTLEGRAMGTSVAMLALVQTLAPDGYGAPRWGTPQQDVPLQELLYQALVDEVVRRREG